VSSLLISLFLPWFSVHVASSGTYSGSGESRPWLSLDRVPPSASGSLPTWGRGLFLPQLPFKLPLPHERLVLRGGGRTAGCNASLLVVLAFVFKAGGFGLSGVGS